MLELRMLPAREGDALWIRWGKNGPVHQLLVDMGPEETGKTLRPLLEKMPEAERRFELLVITHVDSDHIGGVLTCLAKAEPLPGLKFNDVWFNGWAHLDGGRIETNHENDLETWGPAQGEELSSWLRVRRWNEAFDGGPVWRVPGKKAVTVPLADGLTLTVLGPTPDRLEALKPVWETEVHNALHKGTLTEASPGLEEYGSAVPPRLESQRDLDALADSEHDRDPSEANGSSISLLLEYAGTRILLAGDAFPQDLVEGLSAIDDQRPARFDAVKVPHHGSAKNFSEDLGEALKTPRWLFSTDGRRFKHPDAVAIARLLRSSGVPRTLCFNVPSTFNLWWDAKHWRDQFAYCTEYGTAKDGLSIQFGLAAGP